VIKVPVVAVYVKFPDSDGTTAFYSPSTCIQDYFTEGGSYTYKEFKELMLKGLTDANQRVVDKYGFGCSDCLLEIMRVEKLADSNGGGKIEVVGFRS